MAKHSLCKSKSERFKSGRAPQINAQRSAYAPSDLTHVPVDGNDIGKPRESRAQRTLALRSFAMNDVGLQLAELASNRADASLITRSQPADLWNLKKLEPGIARSFLWSMHWLLRTRNDMYLQVGQTGHALPRLFHRWTQPE